MSRVSIVVPNYNHARFLQARIRSILDQTHQDFELIILDDASTDNSLEVIGSYLTDPRVRLVPNERNSGSPFIQWKKGIRLARCEYVWLAESDDFAAPELLETLLGELEREPSAVLAYCQSHRVDKEGAITGSMEGFTREMFGPRWEHGFVNDGPDECRRYLLRRCTIPNASAVVFRKEAYPLEDREAETMRVCGDWLTWAKLVQRGKICFVAEPLNYFRHHDATARSSLNAWAGLRETCRVHAYITTNCSPSPDGVKIVQNGTAAHWRSLARQSRTWSGFQTALETAKVIPRYQNKHRMVIAGIIALEMMSVPLRKVGKLLFGKAHRSTG